MPTAQLGPSPFGAVSVVIGVAFWVFVAIVVVAGVWLAYARNRETQKTIRLAIEKGMHLDPALINTLVVRKQDKPEDYWVGGVICVAIGVGLPILGFFVGRMAPPAFFPIVGAGILVGLIGVGLIVSGILVGRRGKARMPGDERM